ncbi:response regulator [Kiritimatiella glycovorans]|uniref:Phosphate regulon transcriptional regulatory protein PhoB n=1 Tax=Kiritimatiella glycovorans TaxID=1307763 RepID=A0A0G3EHC4_9BACT|nr:response regulator [Kiritimatiella glycovorans]AKJ63569.1 Alkaline phosphatase synthesis transcriptional regulatory protein PhoP [Kiritimatiella glycovorans]
MAKEYLLAVEDEEDILELVRFNLARNGYEVGTAATGEEALKSVGKRKPDLIILDLMLPGLDGIEVCRQLKSGSETADIPVVMLTARGEESDIVTGLEIGADDYITKPFSPRVLMARIKAVLRRRELEETTSEEDVLRVRDLVIHPGRHEVTLDGNTVELTYSEFRVLHFLARRPGWVFTRYQIVDAVHGEDYPVTERSVDVQIVGLRKKLGRAGKYIETVRGVGYRFTD